MSTTTPTDAGQTIYTEQHRCRVSGSEHLVPVLSLGEQALTGVFPASPDQPVARGPLELVWCPESALLQLRHTYRPELMYGENYGYRSGLNGSMVRHLKRKATVLTGLARLETGDLVVDIGSNDATLLKAYEVPGLRRIGVDPTGEKFREYYTRETELVPDFFSRRCLQTVCGETRAKVVTSIAMFYDLQDPIAFARDVHDLLDDDGIWHLEQSYLPSMLRMNSYDTVCHEHIEYYSLSAVLVILEAAELRALDISLNDVNGGSFAVTAARKSSRLESNRQLLDWVVRQESQLGLATPRPYRDFEERVFRHRRELVRLVRGLRARGKRIFGYGASTKGNVLLQFCGFGPDDIECIAEVNPDKFGCFTPGTKIPIVAESEARQREPDCFLVLPWHFRAGILERESDFLAGGGRMIFPLPEIEVV